MFAGSVYEAKAFVQRIRVRISRIRNQIIEGGGKPSQFQIRAAFKRITPLSTLVQLTRTEKVYQPVQLHREIASFFEDLDWGTDKGEEEAETTQGEQGEQS